MILSETRLAVVELMRRYAAAVDRADWDTVRDCYFPDAIDDHGVVKGTRDDLIRYFSKSLGVFDRTLHLVGEPEITICGDQKYEVRTPCIALHWAEKGNAAKNLLLGAIYRDVVEKRGDTCAIAARKVVINHAFEYEGSSEEWPLKKLFEDRDQRDSS